MTEPIKTPTSAAAPVTTAVRTSWNDQKTKLKAQFPNLSDEDLRYENGKKDEMMTRVQIKTGKTKEEFATILNTL